MHVVIVRSSNDPNQALHRLQSTPLLEGLGRLGVRATLVALDDGPMKIDPPTHAVFHYFDNRAIASAAQLRKKLKVKLVCLCSDIYSFSKVCSLADVSDLLLAPTMLHCDMIRSAVMKPVRMLPEAVDPIALPGSGQALPAAEGGNICWFGYPESFDKSMRHVLPQAMKAADFPSGRINLITAPGSEVMPGLRHIVFAPGTFYAATAEFSHALLSHFAHDHHINTFIKSPNKMVTALVRGLVPLASATPSYLQLAQRYQLGGLLFAGPGGLARHLKALDASRDRQKYGLADVASQLLKAHSPEAIARTFLEIVS